MGEWLISIFNYLLWYGLSSSDRKLAEKQVLQTYNLETIEQVIQAFQDQLSRDTITSNQLIRAYQNKNERLAASIIMSSPIGTRIRAIRSAIKSLENKIEDETRNIETKQTTTAKRVADARNKLQKWNIDDPQGLKTAFTLTEPGKIPKESVLPKPVGTPTPQVTPTPSVQKGQNL